MGQWEVGDTHITSGDLSIENVSGSCLEIKSNSGTFVAVTGQVLNVVTLSGGVLVAGSGHNIVVSGGVVQINNQQIYQLSGGPYAASGDYWVTASGQAALTSGLSTKMASGYTLTSANVVNIGNNAGTFQWSGDIFQSGDVVQISGEYVNINVVSGVIDLTVTVVYVASGAIQAGSGHTLTTSGGQVFINNDNIYMLSGSAVTSGDVVQIVSSMCIGSGSTTWTSGDTVAVVSGMNILNGMQVSGCYASCTDISGMAHLSDISGRFTVSGTAMSSGINLTSSNVVGIVSGMYVGSGYFAVSGAGGNISGAGVSGELAVWDGATSITHTSGLHMDATRITSYSGQVEIVFYSGPQVGLPLGTQARPGFVFIGDQNTGFFRPANETVAWVANGAKIMTYNQSGLQMNSGRTIVDRSGYQLPGSYQLSGAAVVTSADVVAIVSGMFVGSGTFMLSGTAVTSGNVVSIVSGMNLASGLNSPYITFTSGGAPVQLNDYNRFYSIIGLQPGGNSFIAHNTLGSPNGDMRIDIDRCDGWTPFAYDIVSGAGSDLYLHRKGPSPFLDYKCGKAPTICYISGNGLVSFAGLGVGYTPTGSDVLSIASPSREAYLTMYAGGENCSGTKGTLRVGFINQCIANNYGSYFYCSGGNWLCQTKDAGGTWSYDTGVPYFDGDIHKFSIAHNDALSVSRFYIDNVHMIDLVTYASYFPGWAGAVGHVVGGDYKRVCYQWPAIVAFEKT